MSNDSVAGTLTVRERVAADFNKWAAPFATKDAACCGPELEASRGGADSFQAWQQRGSNVHANFWSRSQHFTALKKLGLSTTKS